MPRGRPGRPADIQAEGHIGVGRDAEADRDAQDPRAARYDDPRRAPKGDGDRTGRIDRAGTPRPGERHTVDAKRGAPERVGETEADTATADADVHDLAHGLTVEPGLPDPSH